MAGYSSADYGDNTVYLTSGRTLFAPSLGKLNFMYASGNNPNIEEANAIIALGLRSKPITDKNIYPHPTPTPTWAYCEIPPSSKESLGRAAGVPGVFRGEGFRQPIRSSTAA